MIDALLPIMSNLKAYILVYVDCGIVNKAFIYISIYIIYTCLTLIFNIVTEFDSIDSKTPGHQWGKGADLPIYPTTPMEILLLAILCTISVAVIAYMMVVLYR